MNIHEQNVSIGTSALQGEHLSPVPNYSEIHA